MKDSRPEKGTGSAYGSRFRYKLNMPEPGTVMLKWIGLPGVFGLVLFLPHLELMAFIVLGAAGAIFVVLLDLPVIEARQDRVLNEIALQKEREKERGF